MAEFTSLYVPTAVAGRKHAEQASKSETPAAHDMLGQLAAVL